MRVATFDWANAVSGTWTTAADWAGGVVPGPNDTAVIEAANGRAKYTVTVASPVSVGGAVLDSTHATLSVHSTFTAGSMALEAGTLLLDNGTLAGTVSQTGGTLKLSGTNDTLQNVTWQGALYDSGKSTLTITGGLTLTGAGGTGPGSATFGSHVVLDGVSALNDATIKDGTFAVVDTPTLTLGSQLSMDNTGLNLAAGEALINDGVFSGEVTGGTFTNNGTINGAGSIAAASFTNDGVINISNAEFSLDVKGLQKAGASGVINVGDNGSLVFVGSETTKQLDALVAQQHVSTSGSLFGTGISGTLNNAGTTLDVGTGSLFGTFTTYYTHGGGNGVVTGGTILDKGGNGAIAGTLSGLSLQSQAATLSIGLNTELDNVTVTGASVVTGSVLALNGGTLSGVGTVSVTSVDQIGGLVLNGVDITGANDSGAVTIIVDVGEATGVTIDAAQSVSGYTIEITGDSSLNVASGAVLNDAQAVFADPGGSDYFLYGSDGESSNVALGAGFVTTITAGTEVVFGADNAGETTLIASMGTFDVAGTLQLGTSYYYIDLDNTGTIAVSSGGTLAVAVNENAETTIANAGTISANAGSIDIATAIANTGLISDAFGGSATTAVIGGAITGAGTIAISGAGTLALGGTVAAGQVVQFGTETEVLDLSQAAASTGFAGMLDGFAQGDSLVLSGENISSARFSGASIIAAISSGGSIVLATGSRLHGSLLVTESSGNATLTYAGGQPSLHDWSAGDVTSFEDHSAHPLNGFGGFARDEPLTLNLFQIHHGWH